MLRDLVSTAYNIHELPHTFDEPFDCGEFTLVWDLLEFYVAISLEATIETENGAPLVLSAKDFLPNTLSF